MAESVGTAAGGEWIGRLLRLRIAKFFVVSFGSTALDYAVLLALRAALPRTTFWLGFAIAVGYVIGTLLNFFWARRWVFTPSALHPVWEFVAVGVIGGVGLLLTEVITIGLNEGVHWHLLVAKTVAVVSVFLWNFFARRVLVYRVASSR